MALNRTIETIEVGGPQAYFTNCFIKIAFITQLKALVFTIHQGVLENKRKAICSFITILLSSKISRRERIKLGRGLKMKLIRDTPECSV